MINKSKTKKGSKNRFIRIITIPLRLLAKTRDFYVKSMTHYADRMNLGTTMTSQGPGLPRSFSDNSDRSSNNEDYVELVRSASIRSIATSRQQQLPAVAGAGAEAKAQRSRSVAMGRIDEEKPCCYFGEINTNVVKAKNELKYPRSRSHAVARSAFR